MRILITGAAGMIGRKLTARLMQEGAIDGRPVTALDLHDVVPVDTVSAASMHVSIHVGDISEPGQAGALMDARPDIVYHLASIVSGEAETDFELGYRVNLDGSRLLLDAAREAGHVPRLVFASSIAVFGGPFPEVIPDDFHLVPLSSYGTQKAMVEALLVDYTRRGFIDGVGIRLPTICVRPGKPNKAASGFLSNIIREPLVGREAVLPVPRDVVHTHASPRSAVGFLLRAAELDAGEIGPRRNLTMPGVAVTVGEQIEALKRIAGASAAALIRERHDEAIWALVRNWPTRFAASRARDLGFVAEASFEAIIQAHIEDELGGKVGPATG